MPMPLWRAKGSLVLASKSTSRRAILTAAGIPVDIMPADIDERAVEAAAGTDDPAAIAELLAREKSRSVSAQHRGRLVLGADQTLALGRRLFTKPESLGAARAQLMALHGKTHELHSAVAVVRDGAVLFEHRAVARMTMRTFSEGFLDAYLDAAADAVMASVGAYQVERLGIQLFERIEGDHFTILGLPLLPVLAFLRTEGSLAD
jgi:septum formation protein